MTKAVAAKNWALKQWGAGSRSYPVDTLLSISNESLTEGDSGSANMTFTVSRAADGFGDISFHYETADGTAIAGVDYTAVSGDDVISAGESININVPILGDTSDEDDETFTLTLSNIAFV